MFQYRAGLTRQRENIVKLTTEVFPTVLAQLEKKITERGGKFLVGGKLSWADIHLFFFCSDEFLEPEVLKEFPNVADLVNRVGEIPNIKKHMETRPPIPPENDGYLLLYNNAYKLIKNNRI